MPSFPKPKFPFSFQLTEEIDHLLRHKEKRKIPEKTDDKLLVASWNVANLGLQKRDDVHYKLLSEIVGWFDIVAIQEVYQNLDGLRKIKSHLPAPYELVFSDKGGNNERSAFIYDTRKLKLLELIGEVAVSPSHHRYIKLPGIDQKFQGFDRNPYLSSFQFNDFTFILITVHSFFGSDSSVDVGRRALEAYAISRYADLQRKSKDAFSKNIITLGDFNIPKIDSSDLVYKALIKRGLKLPKHSTKVYSNINNDKQYDKIAFLPSIKSKITANGVFDFDSAVFPNLFQNQSAKNFKGYLKYYLSDHRPLWIQLKL